jgi:hypothetical protein
VILSKPSIVPVGVPRSYRELFEGYGPIIKEHAQRWGMPLADVIRALHEKKTIEGFDFRKHAPNTMDRKEVLAYTGLNTHQWPKLLRATELPVSRGKSRTLPWWKQRPLNGSGGYVLKDSSATIYWGPDIIRIRDGLDKEGIPLPSPVSHRIARSFRARLGQMLRRIRPSRPCSLKPPADIKVELEAPLSVKTSDWPSDLPRSNEELMTMYGDYVVNQVRRISKIRTEEELREVIQHTWEMILTSNVLDL